MKKHNVNVQKRKKHYTVGAILWLIVEYVSLIFFGLCAVVPVISCVITAFKTQEEYQATNVMTLPENWLNFDNFIKAFQTADMGRAFLNSVIVMVSVLVVSIIIGTQLAYVLNRFKYYFAALLGFIVGDEVGKRTDPKPVFVCFTASGSCNAGNCI